MTKQTKTQKIAELERKLKEALAGQAFVYSTACQGADKAATKHLMASGAVLTLTALGGRELIPPTLILDGLSDEAIKALKADFLRSFELATLHKPKA